jgi:DNA repair exonuclease SbcCD ATPase subunit
MTIVFAIIAVVCIGLFIAAMFLNKKLEGQVAAANQESERLRQHYESETQRVYNEAQASVAEAQKQIEQQLAEVKQESETIRQHYETETRKSQDAADALVAKTIKDFEPVRRFEKFRDAEAEAQRQLANALKEATSLRAEAQSLMEQAKAAAADERLAAKEKAKALRDQADALLNQATRDAGRIMAEAEKRAEQIGGDAYRALREKELLEQAAEAMRNIIEGYGDRYLIPTHNLLDDLAVEFGYAAAGASLKSALDLSRRMVEQGEAAACDYVEADRRKTAIQFVIHAFKGAHIKI